MASARVCKRNQAAFLLKRLGKATFLSADDAAVICLPRAVTLYLELLAILTTHWCA